MKDTRLRAPSTDGALRGGASTRTRSAPSSSGPRIAWRRGITISRGAGRAVLRGARPPRGHRRSHATTSPRHGVLAPECRAMDGTVSTTPLIVTGHQPELFHPGVWVKNFATAVDRQGPRRPRAEPDRR